MCCFIFDLTTAFDIINRKFLEGQFFKLGHFWRKRKIFMSIDGDFTEGEDLNMGQKIPKFL